MARTREVLGLVFWNLRGIPRRRRSAFVVAAGFFGVIGVFVAVLSIHDGLELAAHPPGGNQVAVVFGRDGLVDAAAVRIAGNAPGVARAGGRPLVAPTLVSNVVIETGQAGIFVTEPMRGITRRFSEVVPDFHLVHGRMFRPGADEVLIGVGGARLFPKLAKAGVLTWNHRPWKIVGTYQTAGTSWDSEFLTALPQLQAANNAGKSVTDLFVRLVQASDFAAFKSAFAHRSGLAVNVETLTQRDLDFSGTLNNVLLLADGLITSLMAIGAVFGALNVLYANVANRRTEFATVRALGFSRQAVLCTVLVEALLLALAGGAMGIATAYGLFNGLEASTEAGGLIAFRFAVTAPAAEMGLALALLMGLAGGLFPALQAARLPIARALRAD